MTHSDEFPYDIEIIAENLLIPWAIAISEDGRLFVTERRGTIQVIQNGELLPEPLITIQSPFIARGEGGLLGIALDPDFIQNHYIYVMHTYTEAGKLFNRIIRLIEENNRAQIDTVILDVIPGGQIHNGGRIKIGSDQKLYIATGDAGTSALSQDLNSMAGKILRIELDGSIPVDNPFPGSPVYGLGLRNPQGLAWNSNNVLFATEHGQMAHDEVNLILPGGNYGWPIVQGYEAAASNSYLQPLAHSNGTTWAPSGLAYVDQGLWQNRLLVATLRGEQLLSIVLNPEGNMAERIEAWLLNEFGRLREVIQAPDGSVYLTTSNRDGRGTSRRGDDKIIRLVPRNLTQ